MIYKSKYATYKDVKFKVGYYKPEGIALQIYNNEGPIAICTLNMPDAYINPKTEIIVKDYSENEGMLEFLKQNDIITHVDRMVESGFVQIPVCKLNIKVLLKHCPELIDYINGR